MKPFVLTIALVSLSQTFSMPPEEPSRSYRGLVLSAEDQSLTMAVDSERIEFIVPPETKIQLDGIPGRLDELRPGFSATVEASRVGKQLIAQQIQATSVKIAGRSQSMGPG